ncbi:hypothetical protein [Mycolicibacterium thermoresistibile]
MTGLRFRETMTGQIALRTTDPNAGYRLTSAVAATLRAEVDIADVAAFIAGPHTGRLRAELIIPVFGGRFLSSDGEFRLFEHGRDPSGRPVREIRYTAQLFNNDRQYRMNGRKLMAPRRPWRVWPDTTRLLVNLTDVTADTLSDPDSMRPREAAGIVRIGPGDFVRQLGTMHGYPADPRLRWVVPRYLLLFARCLAAVYLWPGRRTGELSDR